MATAAGGLDAAGEGGTGAELGAGLDGSADDGGLDGGGLNACGLLTPAGNGLDAAVAERWAFGEWEAVQALARTANSATAANRARMSVLVVAREQDIRPSMRQPSAARGFPQGRRLPAAAVGARAPRLR